MRWDRLTPAEIAGLDIALGEGIKRALAQSSGLLVMKTGASGDGGWVCAFPPRGLSFVAAKEWARRHQLNHARDDLYLTHSEVMRAGADLQDVTGDTGKDAQPTALHAAFMDHDEALMDMPVAIAPPGHARVIDSRGSRAWTQAFQSGFRRNATPVQTDDALFIALLEIADRRQIGEPTTDAGSK